MEKGAGTRGCPCTADSRFAKHGRPQHDPAWISEKRAMEISGHKTKSMFKQYDITDERDIQADGERLARSSTRKQN
jgi:hypothetical protein